MQELGPHPFGQPDRQHIVKTVVDFETMLYTRNINHPDIHTRNVIISNTMGSDGRINAIFVDFGDVLFGRAGYYAHDPGIESRCLPNVYISPLLRWHKAHGRSFDSTAWIDWDWQSWLEAQYGHTAALITEEMRHAFLPDFLLGPLKRPTD